ERAAVVADKVPEGVAELDLMVEVEEARRVGVGIGLWRPVRVVWNSPRYEDVWVATDAENGQEAVLHFNALALVRLSALHFEVILASVVRLDVKVDASPLWNLCAERPEKLIALVLVIRCRRASFELVNALGDELA